MHYFNILTWSIAVIVECDNSLLRDIAREHARETSHDWYYSGNLEIAKITTSNTAGVRPN